MQNNPKIFTTSIAILETGNHRIKRCLSANHLQRVEWIHKKSNLGPIISNIVVLKSRQTISIWKLFALVSFTRTSVTSKRNNLFVFSAIVTVLPRRKKRGIALMLENYFSKEEFRHAPYPNYDMIELHCNLWVWCKSFFATRC